MKISLSLLVVTGSLLVACSSLTAAAVTPFTETFSANNASWTQNNNTAATWVSSGGVNGALDGYITTVFTVPTTTASTPVVARATGSATASGGLFIGDYANISSISFSVKSDATFALPIALRLGSATPGTAVTINGGLLQPGSDWTTFTFNLASTNPKIISYEGTPGADNAAKFAAAISNVANLQIFFYLGDPSYTAPVSATPVTLSVDQVQTVPEPSTYALMILGLGAMAFVYYRRKEKRIEA